MTYAAWPEVYPTLNQPDHENHLDWTFECGARGCNWMTYHRSQNAARAERDRHQETSCPHVEVRKTLTEERSIVPAGPSVIETYWTHLDRVTKAIMEQRVRFKNNEMNPEELEGYFKLQGQAQGLAIAIQIISVPHFGDTGTWENPDPKPVAMWAQKRYKMNTGQIDFEDTPGCQGYNPMPAPTRELSKQPVKKAPARGPAADPKTGKFKALTDDERKHIANMVAKGLPAGVIQGMLKISEEQYDHEVAKLSN